MSRPFGWIVNPNNYIAADISFRSGFTDGAAAGVLSGGGKALPLTYAVDGLKGIMLQGESLTEIFKELAILCGFAVGLLGLASMTVRRT